MKVKLYWMMTKKNERKKEIYIHMENVGFANIYMFIWASTFYVQTKTWRFPVYNSIFMIEHKEGLS